MDLASAIRLNRTHAPTFGELHYVVDSDYRTAAQGWSRADRTGPLDLYEARKAGPGGANYVFRTGDYSSDAVAIQAAIDACVDFRSDTVLFTPGSYSVATALSVDCDSIRLLGLASNRGRSRKTTLTAAVDAAITITSAADSVEIGNMRLVPLTAKETINNSGDYGYLHDLFWDARGVATSTATIAVQSAAAQDWLVERCDFHVDAAQGPAFDLTSSANWVVQDSDFYVALTAVAWASVFTFTTSALGNVVRRCMFRGCGGATAAVFTNIFTGVANVNGQLMVYGCYVDGTSLATAGDIETGFGTTTDIELAENYQAGDATTEGGTLVKLT